LSNGGKKRVLVVGAGITGLSAAYQLTTTRPDIEVRLVEPRERPGGNIVTERRDGFTIDGGPDCFLRTKPEASRLCQELGLASEIMTTSPTANGVYLVHEGRLERMPAGMALAVPTRLGPLVKTPLIGWAGKLRVLGDLFVEHRSRTEDETVASFLMRHFGHEVTYRLAGPLLGGIFSGDIEELSIQSTFPQLVELEKQQGSLIRALFAAERVRAAQAQGRPAPKSEDPFDPVELWSLFGWLRREAKAVQSPFLSLKSGMGTLVAALVERLPPDALLLCRRVERLERQNDGRWAARLDGDVVERFDQVLLCSPAHATAQIMAPHPIGRVLEQVPHVATTTVFFALGAETKTRPLDSSGFMVPRHEGRMPASTWVSSKWAERAPPGAKLLRASLGGAREPRLVESASDADLVAIAREELTRYMGSIEPVLFTRVYRWKRPQPVVGHAARVRKLESLLAELPGMYLAGSGYDGFGISDCIRQGRAAAAAALDRL
jgi:protoporphyrinogen/coproporphyrinogen III oxidase